MAKKRDKVLKLESGETVTVGPDHDFKVGDLIHIKGVKYMKALGRKPLRVTAINAARRSTSTRPAASLDYNRKRRTEK